MKDILIVENNESYVKWYKIILSGNKYSVLIIPSAEESLKSYKSKLEQVIALEKQKRKHSSRQSSSSIDLPFDAVILNHNVSDRAVIQMAREILLVNPRQRIILVSDSEESTEELDKEFYGKVDIIQKPFSRDALIELLESTELYNALEELGLDTQSLKEYNLYHFQLLELLAACLRLLEEQRGNGKNRRTSTC